ncbi:MAG: hypothetical protein ACTSRG_22465 [Candidatus Helarchaeota archaeon]
MQSRWRHLKSAVDGFFRNIKKGIKKGFPRFKSKKYKQPYATYKISNNRNIDFMNKRLKLPKIKSGIRYHGGKFFYEGMHKARGILQLFR